MKKFVPTIKPDKFNKLSILQKRVAIANDVLARIEAGAIQVESGTFLEGYTENGYISSHSRKEDINAAECQACAKGAIVCAWLGGLNKHTLGDFSLNTSSSKSGNKELIEVFGVKLLNRLESAFEGWDSEASIRNHAGNEYGANDHAKKHDDLVKREYDDTQAQQKAFYAYVDSLAVFSDHTRLTILMKNIIKNKGVLLIPGLNKKKGYTIGDVPKPKKFKFTKAQLEWLRALESGKFKKGYGRLTRIKNKTLKHCCLGVACAINTKKLKLDVHDGDGVRYYANENEDVSLPACVTDHLGMLDSGGGFAEGYSVEWAKDVFAHSLIDLNDEAEWSHKKIAQWIRKNPKAVFVDTTKE